MAITFETFNVPSNVWQVTVEVAGVTYVKVFHSFIALQCWLVPALDSGVNV